MQSKYKIILTILSLLLLLSVGISLANYEVSMRATKEQLKTQSLPLSVDNIYTEIQKQIIEPYLVSSMMANDTFVHDWLQEEEHSVIKIQKYLESIKNRYGMLGAFLVSDTTKNYYTQDGFVEKVSPKGKNNKWYYKFKKSVKQSEINIDLNKHLNDNLIMFINFKMFDSDFHYLGATGVAIEISYIKKMLMIFKEKYKLHVSFLDAKGNYVLLDSVDKKENYKNIDEIPEILPFKDKILSSQNHLLEYTKNGDKYILNTKYIPELDAHLLVAAKLDDFTHQTKRAFYLNSVISLLLALIIAAVLINIIRNYNKKLEKLADFDELTEIPNRRNFHNRFSYLLELQKRTKQDLCLLYIDLDNFKQINDTLGHNVGDKVLQEFARLLQKNVRASDLYARWGGEEFIVAFVNTSLEDAFHQAQKIRLAVEHSVRITNVLPTNITISSGLTLVTPQDTINSVISRADEAMYKAKSSGKNRVCTL